MVYKAAFTKSFLREYRKLPKPVMKQAEKAVIEIVEKPSSGTKLRGPLTGYYRRRIGK